MAFLVPCGRQKASLFLVMSIFLLANSLKLSEGSSGFKLDMIDVDDLSGAPLTQLERLMKRLQRDEVSVQRILSTNYDKQEKTGSVTPQSTFKMPISSSYSDGTAAYVVKLKLGTPPKVFTMFADTGSDLNWVMCSYKKSKPSTSTGNVLNGDASTSFKAIPCGSQTCLDLSGKCTQPNSACAYTFDYNVGSAQGILAKETVIFDLSDGKQTKPVSNVLIGCGQSTKGMNMHGVDGLMGLGHSPYSLPGQASQIPNGEFSYCLVDSQSNKNVTSKLILGPSNGLMPKTTTMQYIPMVSGPWPYYGADIAGILVSGTMLHIPAGTWDFTKGGGAIIDSGTSLTYLTPKAYGPVMAALSNPLSKFKKRPVNGFEFCFHSKAKVPKLEFVFLNKAVFTPSLNGYAIDVGNGLKCLGFKSTKTSPALAIIGNIMQQNNLWNFVFKSGQVGFASSSCT